MTAAAAPDDLDAIEIPEPHDNQTAILDDPAQFKVIRAGGRFGKTRLALSAAVIGHGPVENDEPLWRGIAQGGNIAWISIDYVQTAAIWREEIVPRFKGRPGVEVHETSPKWVQLAGGGILQLVSAENIDSLRGRQWAGVVFDECAYLDLEYAWEDVVSIRLVDQDGWAIFISTTNENADGNPEKILPSYFNRLCTKVEAGEMPRTWRGWHFTTFDNPHLSPTALAKFLEPIPTDSLRYRREVMAELITSGAGYAFPEWCPAVHVIDRSLMLPKGWRCFAGMDWGYRSPGCFVLCMAGPEGDVLVRKDWLFQGKTAYDVGYEAGEVFRQYGVPEFIAYDSSTDDTYKLGGPAASMEMQRGLKAAMKREAPALLPTVKEGRGGKSFRQMRKLLLHEHLKFPADAVRPLKPWQRPLLTFHPDAGECIRSIPMLPLDPKDTEDVDTTSPIDHPYDALTYALMGPIPRPARIEPGLSRDRLHLDERGRPVGASAFQGLQVEPQGPRFRFNRGTKREVAI